MTGKSIFKNKILEITVESGKGVVLGSLDRGDLKYSTVQIRLIRSISVL